MYKILSDVLYVLVLRSGIWYPGDLCVIPVVNLIQFGPGAIEDQGH